MTPVVWTDSALDELSDIWVRASGPDERDQIEATIHRLNGRMRANPEEEGESRSANRRVTYDGRMTVVFEIDPLYGVSVIHVYWRPTRS